MQTELHTNHSLLNSTATVNILGRQYALKGDVEPEQMVRVSKYVDQRLHKLRSSIPGIDVTGLLLLTALNLADELFQARQEQIEIPIDKEDLSQMSQKAERLIQMLEKGIIGEESFPLIISIINRERL